MQVDPKDTPNSDDNGPDLLSTKRSMFWHLWKRRALLLVALLILLVPLYGTFAPLFEFILFAVSLATLTFPIFFVPIKRFAGKLFPGMQPQRLAEICAVLSPCPCCWYYYPLCSFYLGCKRREAGTFGSGMVPGYGRRVWQNTLLRGCLNKSVRSRLFFHDCP